jgi:hypothetical protein
MILQISTYKILQSWGISPTTFRRCTSSSFLDREEQPKPQDSCSIHGHSLPRLNVTSSIVVWGGVFQWLNPPDRMFSMENDHGN